MMMCCPEWLVMQSCRIEVISIVFYSLYVVSNPSIIMFSSPSIHPSIYNVRCYVIRDIHCSKLLSPISVKLRVNVKHTVRTVQ